MPRNQAGSCLCCSKSVLYDPTELVGKEAPAVLCMGCYGKVYWDILPWGYVRTIALLGRQVRYLTGELTNMKKNIESLYLAQRDVEQVLLGQV